jgi:hypothetical protein
MNVVSYNLWKFQLDYKLDNKRLAQKLGCSPKHARLMKKESYEHTEEELETIAKLLLISKEELTTEINEKINLKEKKIYGTDYLNVNYKVLNYKSHKINNISAVIDIMFFVVLAVFLITKQISLSIQYNNFMGILKTAFVIELFVFPFMFVALPLLKIYFNRTYTAVLTSNIKEYYQEEACGIIFSCLRRSINKSIIPYVFTIFSELVIGLYCLLNLIYTKKIEFSYLIMVILLIISLVISILSFKYHFEKNGNIVKKGDE